MMTMKRMRMVTTTMMKLVRSVSSRSSGSSIAGQEDRVGASRELFVTPSISEIFVPITTRSPRGYVQLRASRDRRERLASRRGCLNWSVGIRSFHFFFLRLFSWVMLRLENLSLSTDGQSLLTENLILF